MEERIEKRKYCFMWTRVLLSASLTFTVTAFTIIYTVQQDTRDRVHREQEQRDMEKIRTQSVYDAYLNDITQHILSRLNDSAAKTKSNIRSKTLNVLPRLDSTQKTEIILYLYENYLIRSDYLELAIDLSTADLSGCQFKYPCNLNYLHLPGILANNIVFNRCKLQRAVFNGSSMVGSKFINSYVSGSHFDSVNLTNAIFKQTNNLKINFANAILVRSSFRDGPNLQSANLMNADLFESDLTDKQLSFIHSNHVNNLLNTRFPNGSFGAINSSQLILDGGAELSCSTQNRKVFWEPYATYPVVNFINPAKLNIEPRPVEGDCYFQCALTNSEGIQSFSVRHFSLPIDNGQVAFNLSAYFSCPFSLSSAYVQIGFYTEELLLSGSRPVLIESDANSSFHYKSCSQKVPGNTRFIYISVGANNVTTNIINPYCLVDNIRLIFFKDTGQQYSFCTNQSST